MSEPQRHSPAAFVRLASDVSSFYGFRSIHDIERGLPGKRLRSQPTFQSCIESCARRMSVQEGGGPVLAYYATTMPQYSPPTVLTRDVAEFGLQVIGVAESLAEIILLKALFTIAREWGAAVSRVRVNALGDHDSKIRFERELGAYLRKHAIELDAHCRRAVADNPLTTYECSNETCRRILADAPRSMNFLSEKSRAHFREVLEYIENLGLPFEVDDLLVGDSRAPRITFALDLKQEDATLVCSIGGRFDEHIRKLSGRKDVSGVSASIYFRKKGLLKSAFPKPRVVPNPKIYFVQLGLRAKLQSLAIIDMLREAKVAITQSFDAKSLAPQMESARLLGASYILIMGQREAIDGTIIVRCMTNSSQVIIPTAVLPRYLKTLRV